MILFIVIQMSVLGILFEDVLSPILNIVTCLKVLVCKWLNRCRDLNRYIVWVVVQPHWYGAWVGLRKVLNIPRSPPVFCSSNSWTMAGRGSRQQGRVGSDSLRNTYSCPPASTVSSTWLLLVRQRIATVSDIDEEDTVSNTKDIDMGNGLNSALEACRRYCRRVGMH